MDKLFPKPEVLSDEGDIFDADCGQAISCDILPRYINKQKLEACYTEISSGIITFVEERLEAQRDDACRKRDKQWIEWIKEHASFHSDEHLSYLRLSWKDWQTLQNLAEEE